MSQRSTEQPATIECKARKGFESKVRRFKDWTLFKTYGSRAIAEEQLAKLIEQHERLEFRIKS